jgi:DNA topoisomerase-3
VKFYARSAHGLILWLDCDSEGENIAFEVISHALSVNPRLNVFLRAKFSDVSPRTIQTAVQNLINVNKPLSDSVDARIELDLRLGAIFTRF